LIDIPYDTTAVRFLHWTWHDTDSNIYDRHYWVPWNSYYFHATFACAFTFLLRIYRCLVTKDDSKTGFSTSVHCPSAHFAKEYTAVLRKHYL
jgi:hypothetical protein